MGGACGHRAGLMPLGTHGLAGSRGGRGRADDGPRSSRWRHASRRWTPDASGDGGCGDGRERPPPAIVPARSCRPKAPVQRGVGPAPKRGATPLSDTSAFTPKRDLPPSGSLVQANSAGTRLAITASFVTRAWLPFGADTCGQDTQGTARDTQSAGSRLRRDLKKRHPSGTIAATAGYRSGNHAEPSTPEVSSLSPHQDHAPERT